MNTELEKLDLSQGTLPPQSSFRKPVLSRFSTKLPSIKSGAFFVTLKPFSRATSTDSATALAGTMSRRLICRFEQASYDDCKTASSLTLKALATAAFAFSGLSSTRRTDSAIAATKRWTGQTSPSNGLGVGVQRAVDGGKAQIIEMINGIETVFPATRVHGRRKWSGVD